MSKEAGGRAQEYSVRLKRAELAVLFLTSVQNSLKTDRIVVKMLVSHEGGL